jgi:chromosome partitioning protein
MTFIIAMANQKGGVAKTTTAAALGGGLTKCGKEVLLVDMDPQADLTLAFGFDPKTIRHTIADVLFSSGNLVSISRETAVPGLDLLPANSDLQLAERFLIERENYEFILQNVLAREVPLVYDFVILDCPPALSAVTINGLNAADLLLIPTQPEFFSTHALRNIVAAARRARAGGNERLVYRILITMLDRRNRIHRELGAQLKAAFGANILESIIEVDTRLRESCIEGLPITHFAPKTRSAQQYQALAEEIIQYAQETLAQQA